MTCDHSGCSPHTDPGTLLNAEFNQLSRTAIEFKIIGNNDVEFINKAIGAYSVSLTVDYDFQYATLSLE